MFWMPPDRVRAFNPACPPMGVRLAAWVVVAGFALLLLDRGVSSRDTLALLGAVGVLTVTLTSSVATGRRLLGPLRAFLLAWRAPYGGQDGATA